MPRLNVDWNIKPSTNFDIASRKFRRYLEDNGFRTSTIELYIGNVGRYLKFAETDRPTVQDAERFRDILHDRKLGRSTLNQYSYAIKAYHKMMGEDICIKRLNPDNQIPYYFSPDEVQQIFGACTNLKHYAMLSVLFYGALRASELCNLNLDDLDLKSLTINVRCGKGGKDGEVFISEECGKILKQYLAARPDVKGEDEKAVFLTDYGKRWKRTEVHRMFVHYKKKAHIDRPGGPHVFGRHSVASILVKNGCDIMTIKDLLRHEDITTTARYLHLSNAVKREKYKKYLSF